MKYKYSSPRTLHSALIIFFILHSAFYIFVPLARAEPLPPVNSLCFEAEECRGKLYKGTPVESADCKNQDKRWVDAGYIYQCYAQTATVPLQVSIGGYEVVGIEQYIKRLYVYLISIAGIVAGIMIVWAGVKWLTSAGIPDRITEAKKKIGNAVIGLVLVLGSYVILQTINPALVNLKIPPVTMMRQELLGVGTCVNREQYPCGGLHLASPLERDSLGMLKDEWDDSGELFKDGAYQCDDPQNPYITGESGKPIVPPCEGGIKAGKCVPQYCPIGAGGCSTLLKDRVTEGAYNRLTLLKNGSLERILETGVPLPLGVEEYSAQGVIRNFLRYVDKNSKICAQKSQCGNKCDASVLWAVCVSSACDCILELTDDQKIVCAAPLAPEEKCAAHSACASNRCNFGRIPNQCAPVGGELINAPCNEDADCNNTQGLVCNKGILNYNRCRPKEAGGEMCTRNLECVSDACDTSIFAGYQLGCCKCRNGSGGLDSCSRMPRGGCSDAR